VTLTDAGPLVALLDKRDANHDACIAAVKRLPSSELLTTWPCFTEAMYLLGTVGRYRYQAELWKLYSEGQIVLYDLSVVEISTMNALMEKYQDTPMDLADASLVAVAERLSLCRVFTFDTHFYIYRLSDGSMLEIIK